MNKLNHLKLTHACLIEELLKSIYLSFCPNDATEPMALINAFLFIVTKICFLMMNMSIVILKECNSLKMGCSGVI